jgi:hypothetical protein
MTWEELLAQRRVAREPTDHQEIQNLMALVGRNLNDASIEQLSDDGRFERAYAAARALATMVVRACGYRVKRPGSHYHTFQALEVADPDTFGEFAAYFDSCRALRNTLSYESTNVVPKGDLEEILDAVPKFTQAVEDWLRAHHPELSPKPPNIGT